MHDVKEIAGRRAARMVDSGMTLGLGTGSTVHFFLEALAERIRAERLEVRGVPTSIETERKAREFGIPLATLDQIERLDLTVDGADEIDTRFDMIKGGGGALLREKVVASVTKHVVIISDSTKVVDRLGKFPLPVEVIPMARSHVARQIARRGGQPVWRDGVTTDNGNWILDVHNLSIVDPVGLEREFNQIVGVVAVGLFAARPADIVLCGNQTL